MTERIRKVKRKINYFDLDLNLDKTTTESDAIHTIFKEVNNRSTSINPSRLINRGEKILYVPKVEFAQDEKHIKGKIYLVRENALPQLMDRENDKTRGVNARPAEDVIESSHFIISYKGTLKVAFEHNHQGARYSDLEHYLLMIAGQTGVSTRVKMLPICRDDIDDVRNRINRISMFIGRIRKDELKRLDSKRTGLISAFDIAEETSDAEYVELKLKFDYKTATNTSKIREAVIDLMDKLKLDKTKIPFDILWVKAEDSDNNDRLKEFDLLNIWVRSVVAVEQEPRHRTIVSIDMFSQIAKEFKNELNR